MTRVWVCVAVCVCLTLLCDDTCKCVTQSSVHGSTRTQPTPTSAISHSLESPPLTQVHLTFTPPTSGPYRSDLELLYTTTGMRSPLPSSARPCTHILIVTSTLSFLSTLCFSTPSVHAHTPIMHTHHQSPLTIINHHSPSSITPPQATPRSPLCLAWVRT